MARKKKKGRGISPGTIIMLATAVLTLLTGVWVFARISGDMDSISIDPKLLTEPLNILARAVTDTGDAGGDSSENLAAFTPVQTAAPAAPTATPEPTLPAVRTLTLTAAGQVTLGAELREAGVQGSGYDFSPILSPVSQAISGADLSIVTLRTGLTESVPEYETYRAPAALAAGLQSSGFNMFNLATDRVIDYGAAGLTTTRMVLEQTGAYMTGAYRTQEERERLSVGEISGVKVGVLSYTSTISAAGQKAATSAEIQTATRMLDLDAAASDIAALRTKGAEIIIVLVHWGSRSDSKPSRETQTAAEALANAGADIILGTGPTNVHNLERRTVADAYGGTREVFIAYSLGNFLIDDSRDTTNITGLILHLEMEWNANTQRMSIQDAWYMPTWIMRYRDTGGVNRYRVVPAGTYVTPENMTDSIYSNMRKSYQSLAEKLGTDAARPKAE